MCRTCHLTNALPFSREIDFRNAAPLIAADLCSYTMPHALQVIREFWQSSRPSTLQSYFRSVGQTAAEDQLRGCGPGNVATLDPPALVVTMATHMQ